ncbi:hypothetical protein C0J45_9974 [Silurus meridionalis]|nr:hypothetical protein C0J45_9974 [Silurus meridionalis]
METCFCAVTSAFDPDHPPSESCYSVKINVKYESIEAYKQNHVIDVYNVDQTLSTEGLLSGESVFNVSGEEGSTAVLNCKLEHVDAETYIRWRTESEIVFERKGKSSYQADGYKDRVDVPEEELRKGNCSLVLRNLTLNDKKVYICSYKVRVYKRDTRIDTGFKETSRVFLSVREKPPEEKSEKRSRPTAFFTPCLLHITSSDFISVHPGENITLLCNITDYPEISWYQLRSDEVKLLISAEKWKLEKIFFLIYNVDESHYDVTESSSSVSLVIIGVRETDLGFYYCGGRNDDKHIQFGKLIRLNFTGKSVSSCSSSTDAAEKVNKGVTVVDLLSFANELEAEADHLSSASTKRSPELSSQSLDCEREVVPLPPGSTEGDGSPHSLPEGEAISRSPELSTPLQDCEREVVPLPPGSTEGDGSPHSLPEGEAISRSPELSTLLRDCERDVEPLPRTTSKGDSSPHSLPISDGSPHAHSVGETTSQTVSLPKGFPELSPQFRDCERDVEPLLLASSEGGGSPHSLSQGDGSPRDPSHGDILSPSSLDEDRSLLSSMEVDVAPTNPDEVTTQSLYSVRDIAPSPGSVQKVVQLVPVGDEVPFLSFLCNAGPFQVAARDVWPCQVSRATAFQLQTTAGEVVQQPGFAEGLAPLLGSTEGSTPPPVSAGVIFSPSVSAEDVAPLRVSAGVVSPPPVSAEGVVPLRVSAGVVSPPPVSAEDVAPLRVSAGVVSPPPVSAEGVVPLRVSAGVVSPPSVSAEGVVPLRVSARVVSPPSVSAEGVVPLRASAGVVSPPPVSAEDVVPLRASAGVVSPPPVSAEDVAPLRRSGSPQGSSLRLLSPPGTSLHSGSPWGGVRNLPATPPSEAAFARGCKSHTAEARYPLISCHHINHSLTHIPGPLLYVHAWSCRFRLCIRLCASPAACLLRPDSSLTPRLRLASPAHLGLPTLPRRFPLSSSITHRG